MTNDIQTNKQNHNFEKAFYKLTIIQTLLAIVGISTGCIALYAALSESDAVRKQQQAIVLPILQLGITNVENDSDKKFFQLSVNNAGIGPAVVKSIRIMVDDKEVSGWRELFIQIGVEQAALASMKTSYIQNRVISADETVDAVYMEGEESEPLFSAFNSNFNRFSVEVCYCSVFDDCWQFNTQKPETLATPEKIKFCAK